MQAVQEPNQETVKEKTSEFPVIRIKSIPSKINMTVKYLLTVLEEKHPTVDLIAAGKAIPNAILIAEHVKQKLAGIHQIVCIGTAETTKQMQTKFSQIPTIRIILSTDPTKIDATHPSYTAPLQTKEPKQADTEEAFNRSQS